MVIYNIIDYYYFLLLYLQESFQNIKSWLTEIDKFGGGHVAKLLVGNKCDLANKRVVSYDAALVSTPVYVLTFSALKQLSTNRLKLRTRAQLFKVNDVVS